MKQSADGSDDGSEGGVHTVLIRLKIHSFTIFPNFYSFSYVPFFGTIFTTEDTDILEIEYMIII